MACILSLQLKLLDWAYYLTTQAPNLTISYINELKTNQMTSDQLLLDIHLTLSFNRMMYRYSHLS